jgi:hypothetical protein
LDQAMLDQRLPMTADWTLVLSTRSGLHLRKLLTESITDTLHPTLSQRPEQRRFCPVQQVQHPDVIPDGPIGFGVAGAELAIDPAHPPDRRITPERLVEQEVDFEHPLFFRRQRFFVTDVIANVDPVNQLHASILV